MVTSRNDKFYILYAEDYNNIRYYISNLNPVIWDKDINNAKRFLTSKTAEFAIVGDYYKWKSVNKQKSIGNIYQMYVQEMNTAGEELRRVGIL